MVKPTLGARARVNERNFFWMKVDFDQNADSAWHGAFAFGAPLPRGAVSSYSFTLT